MMMHDGSLCQPAKMGNIAFSKGWKRGKLDKFNADVMACSTKHKFNGKAPLAKCAFTSLLYVATVLTG